MPFDSKSFVESVPATLEGLAYVLRHRELWPKEFVWKFSHLGKCAIGLASVIWPDDESFRPSLRIRPFGLDGCDAYDLFVEGAFRDLFSFRNSRHRVTPEVIASRIDTYLSNH